MICGTRESKEAYLSGRGNITLRGVAEVDTEKDKTTITITEPLSGLDGDARREDPGGGQGRADHGNRRA